MAVELFSGVTVTVTEFQIRNHGRVSEWSDLGGMKLNASKTRTRIVSRSRTMHPQLPTLTIGGTLTKMTFEKHLRSVSLPN